MIYIKDCSVIFCNIQFPVWKGMGIFVQMWIKVARCYTNFSRGGTVPRVYLPSGLAHCIGVIEIPVRPPPDTASKSDCFISLNDFKSYEWNQVVTLVYPGRRPRFWASNDTYAVSQSAAVCLRSRQQEQSRNGPLDLVETHNNQQLQLQRQQRAVPLHYLRD